MARLEWSESALLCLDRLRLTHVHVYSESDDRVVVVSVEDGRTASATIAERRRSR